MLSWTKFLTAFIFSLVTSTSKKKSLLRDFSGLLELSQLLAWFSIISDNGKYSSPKYWHKAATGILHGTVSLMLCEYQLLQEGLAGGSWMGFSDSEKLLKVYKIFMCRHIFPGRVQSSRSHWSLWTPKGTNRSTQCHSYLSLHLSNLLWQSPAGNTAYPDKMPKEPWHDIHHTDLWLPAPSALSTKWWHLEGRDCDF